MSTNRPDAALQRAFAVLVAAALAALVVAGVWAHAQYAPLEAATRRIEHARGVVPAIDAIMRAAIDAESASRGQLLGSARSLQRYRDATANARARLAEIAPQVDGDDGQQADLARLRAALQAQFALLDRAMAPATGAADGARAAVLGDEATRRLAEIRQLGDAMVARENRHFDERIAIGHRVRHATEAFAAAAVAVLAFVLAGAVLLTRRELRLRAALADDLRASRNRFELSERRLKAITDNLPALIGYVDRGEVYRFLNAAYRPIFGIDPDAAIGRTMTELLGPATRAFVDPHVRAALAGEPRTFEHHGIGRASSVVLETSYLPDVNPAGGVDGFYVMAIDVTARRAAERERAQGERRLRMITDSVPALIGHVDANEVHRFVNAAYEDVFDVPRSELVGRTLAQMLGAAGHAKVAAQVARALRGEPQRFELVGVGRRQASTFDVSLLPDFNAAGCVDGIYTMMMDITERKRAEVELATSERRLRTITDNLPATVTRFDRSLTCTYANERFRDFYGVDPASLVGSSQRAFRGDAEWAVLEPHVEAALRGERRDFEAVAVMRGEPHWMQQSLIPERDADGRVRGYLSVAFDITGRKRQEEALRKSELFLDRSGRLGGIGGWELALESMALVWSDQAKRIHGVPLDYAPTFETALEFYPPPQRARVRALVQEAIANGTPYDVEMPLVRADGRRISVRVIAAVERPPGEPARLVGAIQDVTELVAQREALTEANERIALATESGGIGIWELDLDTGELLWDKRMHALYGDAADGRASPVTLWDQRMHPDDVAGVDEAIREAAAGGAPLDREFRLVMADGSTRHLRGTARVTHDAAGRARRLIGATWDITELRQLAADLAEDRQLLRVTLESIGDAVITADAGGAITWLNPVAERLTGWDSAAARGRALGDVFRVVDEHTRAPAPDPVARCLALGRTERVATQSLLISRTGREYGIEDSAAPIRDEAGAVLGVVIVFHDVSEQRRLSGEMNWRATHDTLTGLVNRAEFEARLKRMLDKAHEDGSAHALLYIDLDQFKLVNDTCGHAVGDLLLQQMARMLADAVRTRDTVARLGGDEFAIIMEHCSAEQALRTAQKLCERMEDFRFIHEDRRFRVGTSIGLVPVDRRWTGVAAIQQAADTSCYAAKEAGRNRVHAWMDSDTAVRERQFEMQWTARIEHALDEDGFALFAQRIEPLKGPTAGLHAEVLLRMKQADGSLVAPGAFLPAAERFHLASRVDRWVLRHVVDWMVALSEPQRIELLSVNLSGQSVGDRSFHRWALELLARAGPRVCGQLCLEITETAAVTRMTDAAAFVDEVRAIGVKVALDDFGAGAASFGYLKTLRVDTLKIDGQFVRDLVDDALDEAAVRCFADVAKVMGLRTVAEFVDKPSVLARLRTLDVDFAQGFLLHRPAPIGELVAPPAH